MDSHDHQSYTVMFGWVPENSWKHKFEQATRQPWVLMQIVGVPLFSMSIFITMGFVLTAAHTPFSLVIFILFIWRFLHDHGAPCVIYGFMLEVFRATIFKTQVGTCIDAGIETWIADDAAQTWCVPVAKGLNWLCSATPHKTDCILETMGHLLTIAVVAFMALRFVGPNLWKFLWYRYYYNFSR